MPKLRAVVGRLRRLAVEGRSKARRNLAVSWWPVLQQTAAATVAWLIARHVVDHPQPFFAPVAAVVALNTDLGERGLNALRLLQGVIVGIVVGELAIAALGEGYLSLALATFTAMAIAQATGGTRIVIAQAAVGAILVVATTRAEQGYERFVDALVGAGVALVFSNVLFSPEPLALVRRAEAAALRDLAAGLELTAAALESGDEDDVDRALTALRRTRGPLAQLARMRLASGRITRHSLLWRARRAPVVRENENAGQLDLLETSCVVLARTVLTVAFPQRAALAPAVRGLAAVLAELARDPADRQVRQYAADRAVDIVRRTTADGMPAKPLLALAFVALRMVATDILIFAGIAAGPAADAIADDVGGPVVVAEPAAPARRWPRGGRGRPIR